MTRLHAPKLRLGLVLWLLGMLGVVAVTATVVPQLLPKTGLPIPVWAILLVQLVQSALLLALAVWLGTMLAPATGLGAPTLAAIVEGRPAFTCFSQQLRVGVMVGTLSGLGLATFFQLTPEALLAAAAAKHLTLPVAARVLYGGITEELLLRWGLMTVMVWLAWRFLQHRQGLPKATHVWLAIGMSALLFGALHLPAAASLLGGLTPSIIVFVLAGNTIFGVVFGYLYWRHGLEAAMLAHATAHVVVVVLGLL